MQVLGEAQISLEVATSQGSLHIPHRWLALMEEAVTFQIKPLTDTQAQSEVLDRAKGEEMVQDVARDGQIHEGHIQLIGQPVTIETSLQDRPITIILPLPAGLLPEDGQLPDDHQLSQAQAKDERASFLENLVIYVEHSNGQKELIRPQAVEYAPGEWGLQFVVDHFSLFSILYIEGAADYFNQVQTRRLYGQDRYETAVKIAQAGWKEGAKTVILARGDDFADTLAAAPLAYLEEAPILLSESHQLPENVLKEILRLKPNRIILIGGTKALSESIEEQLKAVEEQLREFAEQQGQELKDFAFSLERIEGANRYATAVEIARQIWSKTNGTGVAENGTMGSEISENKETESKRSSGKAVFLASGTDFPDALAIASYAARFHIPILLTESNRLPEETIEALTEVKHTWVIGGEKAVSAQVYAKLPSPERFGGADRYGTLKEVMTALDQRLAIQGAYLASGRSYPDALAGSVLAARENRPLLLTEPGRLSSEMKEIIRETGMKDLIFLGGPSAIRDQVEDEVKVWMGNDSKISIKK